MNEPKKGANETQPDTTRPPVVEFRGHKSLPMYFGTGIALEPISQFTKGSVRIDYRDPDYDPPEYRLDPRTLPLIGIDPEFAIKAVKSLIEHQLKFLYFVQLKDDESRVLTKALHEHTEVVSTICDNRLQIDPSSLWDAFDAMLDYQSVQTDYIFDANRESKWDKYADRLEEVSAGLSRKLQMSQRLVQRAVKKIELQRLCWPTLAALADDAQQPTTKIDLFYSYCHADEVLRDELEKHLSIMKHQGLIENWHDRKITGGVELDGRIDEHLNSANVILLLISVDFLASNYCWNIEMKRAMERHRAGDAKVIPVILRACDWDGSPFGSLLALPKDAIPVNSWSDIDEAFTDVARGIRRAIDEIQNPDKPDD